MKELLQAGCELLAENRNTIHKGFMWDMELMSIAGSLIFTGAGKTADVERMKACKSILKKQESVFSSFRSNMEIPVLCKMALSDDPEGYLRKLRGIDEVLSKGRIFGSEQLSLAAMTVCDVISEEETEAVAEKAKQLIKAMKQHHPMLTSDEDMPFAALLAPLSRSVDDIIEETEYCYNVMKQKFSFHNNAVQSLSHVLTLCVGEAQAKCDRVSAIYDALVVKGLSYGKDYELASLGALVNIDMTPEELADEIADADQFLKQCKGFGDWSVGQKSRLMFAALMAAQAYAPCSKVMDLSVMGGSLAMVIAEEVCLMATTMMICSTTSSN